MNVKVIVLLVGCAALAACASPEAIRQRDRGPGGDVGNRPATVSMHGGSNEYWKTAKHIPGEHPSLEPAEHAREVGRQ